MGLMFITNKPLQREQHKLADTYIYNVNNNSNGSAEVEIYATESWHYDFCLENFDLFCMKFSHI